MASKSRKRKMFASALRESISTAGAASGDGLSYAFDPARYVYFLADLRCRIGRTRLWPKPLSLDEAQAICTLRPETLSAVELRWMNGLKWHPRQPVSALEALARSL